MELIAFLGADKENWGQVTALIKKGEWDKVLVVKAKDTESFPYGGEAITIDTSQSILELKTELMEKIKDKISGEFEVALSIASGNGKEHMALISALLGIPVGIRFAVFTKEVFKFIN